MYKYKCVKPSNGGFKVRSLTEILGLPQNLGLENKPKCLERKIGSIR